MKKIGLIGSVGNNEPTSSGQTIRTRILYDALNKHYGEDAIVLADTHCLNTSKIKFGFQLLKCLFSCRDIILIVSRNGLHTFLPILSFLQKRAGKRIYNNVIGGNIDELIESNPKYVGYMKSFVVNWVQMRSLADKLEARGIENAEVLPNSKPIKLMPVDPRSGIDGDKVRFCTFSRISKAKGIELAVSAVQELNEELGREAALLDIYGVPDEDYKAEFEELLKNVRECISYKGVIPYDRSSEVLKDYYMLLFPTTFYGEGFPGTILDAYASNLPVLASDWKYNPELLKEGETGLLYRHDDPAEFKSKLRFCIENRELISGMRENCGREAQKYTPENVMPIIFNKIDSLRKNEKRR